MEVPMAIHHISGLHRPHELWDLPRQSLDGVSVVLDLRERADRCRPAGDVTGDFWWVRSLDSDETIDESRRKHIGWLWGQVGLTFSLPSLFALWEDWLQNEEGYCKCWFLRLMNMLFLDPELRTQKILAIIFKIRKQCLMKLAMLSWNDFLSNATLLTVS